MHVRNTDFSGKGNSAIFNTRYFSIRSFSLLDMVFSGGFLVLDDTSPARISFLGLIPGTSTQPSHASLAPIVDTLTAVERRCIGLMGLVWPDVIGEVVGTVGMCKEDTVPLVSKNKWNTD